MIYLVRNSDRTIKTYLEKGDDYVLLPGETMEAREISFRQFAAKLRLTVDGRGGELVRVPKGAPPVQVRVEAPLTAEMPLLVNDTVEVVPLSDGAGTLRLGTEQAGLFIIQPFDRATYCAAGEALLAVEVIE